MFFDGERSALLYGLTRSQLINSIDILRARRATGLMTRDNYRTVNNITLGKYPEAK
ncbi:toxin YeeV [Escherichia coli]|nr:toxin YeeV [Escherichia coli]HAK9670190.1 toxin YeeV [Escherichia coli]HAW3665882.1 toxin YeeV [Escherichia coli]